MGIAPNALGASLDSTFFGDMLSQILSQITKTYVKFNTFDVSISPKIKFKLGNVEFQKNNRT
jgi:hypothetical protein